MVTGLVSPTECEVTRPMRPLDKMGSSLLDPVVRLLGQRSVSGAGVLELKGAWRPR
jgi:hypothetical protein